MREHYVEGVPLVVDLYPSGAERDAATAPRCKTRSVRQPSAEGIRAAISRRFNSVRYAVGDVL